MAVRIAYAVARQIAEHALSAAPDEACGILAGTRAQISRAIPLKNAADAPDRQFRFDPEEQLAALKALDADELGWVGVYHSHPKSPPIPSPEDIAAAVDSGLLQLIVSLESARPKLKLWQVEGSSVTPLSLALDTEVDTPIDDRLSQRHQVAIVVAAVASVLLLLAVSLMLLPPAPELAPPP
ncbi:MAG: M67 family metallopeptidase [Chloroflexi bacterium]|nr:M67 family metallopeptidase [Chloroflexota bacterium]